jgi:hypothetical protein
VAVNGNVLPATLIRAWSRDSNFQFVDNCLANRCFKWNASLRDSPSQHSARSRARRVTYQSSSLHCKQPKNQPVVTFTFMCPTQDAIQVDEAFTISLLIRLATKKVHWIEHRRRSELTRKQSQRNRVFLPAVGFDHGDYQGRGGGVPGCCRLTVYRHLGI